MSLSKGYPFKETLYFLPFPSRIVICSGFHEPPEKTMPFPLVQINYMFSGFTHLPLLHLSNLSAAYPSVSLSSCLVTILISPLPLHVKTALKHPAAVLK